MNCENEFEMFKDFVQNTDEEFNDGKFEYTHEFSEVKNLHVKTWTNYLPDYDENEARSKYIELEAIYETEDRILISLYGPRDCLECNIHTCIKGENSLKDKINKFLDEYPLILERHPTLKEGNIVIGLGAGTITNLGKYLKEQDLASRV